MAKPLRLSKERLIDEGYQIKSDGESHTLLLPDGTPVCSRQDEGVLWEIAAQIQERRAPLLELYNERLAQATRRFYERMEDLNREQADLIKAHHESMMDIYTDMKRDVLDTIVDVCDVL